MDSHHLILASASPRRKYLLEQAGLSFDVIPSAFDEDSVAFTDPASHVKDLAQGKAVEVGKRHPGSWIIGADTEVTLGNGVLGKPKSREAARQMLKSLSGRTHKVLTGFCLYNSQQNICRCDAVTTDVVFKELRQDEIEWYIHTDEPYDKAGAYAVQGMGASFIRRVNGSYTNVVGLPVCEVMDWLVREGAIGFKTGASGPIKSDKRP